MKSKIPNGRVGERGVQSVVKFENGVTRYGNVINEIKFRKLAKPWVVLVGRRTSNGETCYRYRTEAVARCVDERMGFYAFHRIIELNGWIVMQVERRHLIPPTAGRKRGRSSRRWATSVTHGIIHYFPTNRARGLYRNTTLQRRNEGKECVYIYIWGIPRKILTLLDEAEHFVMLSWAR